MLQIARAGIPAPRADALPAIRVEDVNATPPRSTKWGSAQRLVARGHQFTNPLVLAREPQRLGWNQFIPTRPVFTEIGRASEFDAGRFNSTDETTAQS